MVNIELKLLVDCVILPRVSKFKYLGSVIAVDGTIVADEKNLHKTEMRMCGTD